MAKEQGLKTKKVLIFASGNGSNFEAIVKHFNSKAFYDRQNLNPKQGKAVEFELVVDKKNAPAIERAKKLNIPYFYVKFENLYDFLTPRKNYDLFVLAGFMRILPEKILKLCTTSGEQNKFINIHPSLLPKFKGKNAITQAFEANVKETGVTVHFVEKKVDSGKIIAQKSLPIGNKSLAELEFAIHKIEHTLYPEIIENLLFKTNTALFGGGAREHALAQKLINSPFLDTLYLINPNDGFKTLGQTLEFAQTGDTTADYKALARKARMLNIKLLVVGPENPLFDGISDIFQKEGIKVIGTAKKWAALEGSKSFAKVFMAKNGIKTADYKVLEHYEPEKIKYFTAKYGSLPVIKADGAALGKGVALPKTLEETEFTAKEFLNGKFGEASKKILIEERLFGKEISVMSLWDGKTLVSFPPASDYKRLLDDNKGKNTGGMGAIAPSKISAKEKKLIKEYLDTLKSALIKEKADFTGVIYSGLILTKKGVYVLEYNMRFGDPETQALLELLETDLLYIFNKTAAKELNEVDIKFNKKSAYCLILASSGYPDTPKKGALIENLDSAKKNGCKIYFAGVKNSQNSTENAQNSTSAETATETTATSETRKSLQTNSGRVLSIVKSAPASRKKTTLQNIYKSASDITFDGKIYRKDIGKNL